VTRTTKSRHAVLDLADQLELGGIDAEEGDPYRGVVEAELGGSSETVDGGIGSKSFPTPPRGDFTWP
jgi:hypothetical protein